jgi:23S rRNA (adenine2030-N6)-methyltransferase
VEEPDYSHRFHAGNVGDVWKHCVLVELLTRLAAAPAVHYVETHAGEGRYALGPTGEWTEGIGRLWARAADAGPVGRYLERCRRLGTGDGRPLRYPGSPAFAAAILGARARLRLWERDAGAHARLCEETAGDARVRVAHGDGLAALAAAVRDAERGGGEALVLIDPPYNAKADWTTVPDALVGAAAGSRHARFLLWYPVKSLTRPNAMLQRLERAGLAAAVAELVTTPLELRRNRLNGSGVVLVRPPAGALERIASAAPVVGAACATHGGAWSARLRAWGGPVSGGPRSASTTS